MSKLHAVQGEQLKPISRFQACAVGSNIYIHTHRSLQDILVLDVADPDAPQLASQKVSGKVSGSVPSARQELLGPTFYHIWQAARRQQHHFWARLHSLANSTYMSAAQRWRPV